MSGSVLAIWYKEINKTRGLLIFIVTNPVSFSDGLVIEIEGGPETRRRWQREAPGTLLSVLAAAQLTRSSLSANDGECGM